MRRASSILLLLSLLVFVAGCDLFGDDDETPSASGVYVANAGGFGNQNSSITIYNPETGDVQELPPQGQAGFASYIQSIRVIDGSLYVVFGETGTVDVYDVASNEQTGQIAGIPNPRYVAVDGDRAYVTSQDYGPNASDLDVVDVNSDAVVDSVNVGGTPEDVTVVGDRVAVALGGFGFGSSIALVNPQSLEVQTVDVGCTGPRSLVDAGNRVVVFCTGRAPNGDDPGAPGAVRVVNVADGTLASDDAVDLDTQISSASFGQHVSFSPAASEAYALLATGEVLRYGLDGSIARLDVSGAPAGAVGYDTRTEQLYVGRLAASGNPFDTPGTVTVHDRSGAALDTLDAGIAPAHVDVSPIAP